MENEKAVAEIPEINVKSIHMDERGCDISIESQSVLLLVEHFGKLLGDAPNFMCMSVMHPEIGMIDVTLQKVLGKPQAQVLGESRKEVAALKAESLRFYHADGTFETLGSAEEVTKRRIACATEMDALRTALTLCEHKITQTIQGQYPQGQALEAAQGVARSALSSNPHKY